MKSSSKIYVWFLLVALVNIAPAFMKIRSTEQIHGHLNVIIESNLVEQEAVSQLSYFLQRAKSNIRELLLELTSGGRNQAEIENAQNVIQKSIAGLEKNYTLLKDATIRGSELHSFSDDPNSAQEITDVEVIGVDLNKFIVGAKEFTAVAKDSGDEKYLLGIFVNVVEPLSRTLQSQIETFKGAEVEESHQEINSIAEHLLDIKKIVVWGTIISFIATLILAWFYGKVYGQKKLTE